MRNKNTKSQKKQNNNITEKAQCLAAACGAGGHRPFAMLLLGFPVQGLAGFALLQGLLTWCRGLRAPPLRHGLNVVHLQ